MFYLLIQSESPDDAFMVTSGNAPKAFATEDDAIANAKDYSGTSLVLKPIASVTEKTTYKVEKIK